VHPVHDEAISAVPSFDARDACVDAPCEGTGDGDGGGD
jgi:hypothetical protein